MNKMRSLKHQLFLRLVIPLLVFVTIDTVLSYFVTLHYVNEAYDRWLIDSAKSLAQEIKVRDDKTFVELPLAAREILEWDETDKVHFKILSNELGLLAGDALVPNPPTVLSEEVSTILFEDNMSGEPVRVASIRIIPKDAHDEITIHVAETLNKRRLAMRDILLADSIPQLLLIMITGVYLLAGIKRGLQPLHSLANEIAQRSPHDLRPIPETEIFLEVRTLTDKINDLLGQLDQAIATQNRFIGNAAHQLRTPLAGLKLQAERVLRERDLNSMRPVLRQILERADSMSHIIAQLLLLAKSEPIKGGYELEPVDILKLTKEVCMEWAPKTRKHKMEISFEGPDERIIILGDETLLRELLANLLDNAIKYGREHGHIHVTLRGFPVPCLVVEDDGPGISSDEVGKVFERFYRARNSPGGGSGLGLAIVKEIADLHHARITVSPTAGTSGTRIALSFSAADQSTDGL